MTNTRDILLHPVRMRIFVEVTGGPATARSRAEALPDVPQATLYRHINALAEAGFLKVIEENPKRGTVERVYGLGASGLTADDLRGMTIEELRNALHIVVGGLVADFERYAESKGDSTIDPIAEGFEITKTHIHLSDEEFIQLNNELFSILKPRLENHPTKSRKRRMLSYMFMPIDP